MELRGRANRRRRTRSRRSCWGKRKRIELSKRALAREKIHREEESRSGETAVNEREKQFVFFESQVQERGESRGGVEA